MRLIKKIKAALGGLCSLTCQRINTLASHWLPLLLILASAEMTGTEAFAATEPETTLTNTVKVAYTVGSGASIQKQASVSLVTSKRTPAKIAFYSVFDGGSQTQVPETQFSLGNSSGTNWSSVDSSVQGATPIIETFSFSAGEPLIIRVEDFDQNLDSSVRETITIDLEINNTGDTETLLLTESEPGSGVFIGVVPMVSSESVTQFDGQLSVEVLSRIGAIYTDIEDETDTVATLGIVEPSNVVFDSTTGEPINGAVISLISSSSGEGARVYTGDDGSWPSTVISGSPVTLSQSARSVEMGQGEFRYPRVFGGEYFLKVVPPVGYRFPSQQSQTQIIQLGEVSDQVEIGSRGEVFRIDKELGAVLLNIPLDPFDGRFSVSKKSNVDVVSIGDEIEYTITAQNHDPLYELNNVYLRDTLPPGFRYIDGSAKFSIGATIPSSHITVNGRMLKIALGSLLPDAEDSVSYRVRVGAGSPTDEAINSVQGFSDDANSNVAHATVEMRDELMHQKNILIGRVFSGKCDNTEKQYPVKNARLYLNNGRTVLTDDKGRWHMEGLDVGSYVVQLDEASLPAGVIASPCKTVAQHTGKRYARMLQLRKGNIWRADFHVDLDKNADLTAVGSKLVRKKVKRLIRNPLQQFGAEFASKVTPEFEFLWPPEGHVPAISTIKIAVQYPPKNRLKVLLNDEEVSPINLEGTSSNKDKTVGISRWTGVDIKQKNNTLTAVLTDKSGKELKRIERHVHFTERSIKASLVKSESVLLADGRNQPVIAIRLEDKDGFTPRPRTHGFYSLEHDHWKVVETDSGDQNDRVELNKSQDGKYEYKVSDDGLVRVRLEPTARSGIVIVNVPLDDGETATIRAWLQPALRDWIMVGYAKGTVGYQTLSGNLETLSDLDQEEGRYQEGRVSFFAKGRVKGKYLLTLAYDSDKQIGEVGEQLNGTIDPDAWYTLYGDEQTQQYEAPSSSKLYVKLEKEQFYALFGDYQSDLDTTELGRYQRTLHGLKSSYEGENYQYSAFVSETSDQYQRDDIRGDGTSGLYNLTREVISNSETITIETRDRDHPEIIVDSRSVSRYFDYDIDYENGSLFFKFPISGTDDELNPIYIVVEYESEDDKGDKEYIAGGRVGYTSDDESIKVGLSYLRESADDQLLAVDASYKINDQLKLKAEVARSESDVKASAWLAEAEYRKDKVQGRLYANQQDDGFGLGQQSGVSEGERKVGITTNYKLSDDATLILDASRLLNLETNDSRVRASAEWQKVADNNKFSVGLVHTDESIGNESRETQSLKVGTGKVLNNGRLALATSLEKTLSDVDTDGSPDRLKLSADYKLTEKVTAFVEQEFTRNDSDKGSNTRVGLKTNIWEGGSLHSDLVRETDEGDITSSKDYFLLGMSQHWKVNDKLHFDFSFDKAETLDLMYDSPLDTDEGGALSGSDDYYAISIGTGWNSEKWSAAGRLEYRDSDASDRSSLQYKAVRKQGDHYAVSKQFRIVNTEKENGDSEREAKFGFSFALRSKEWKYTLLNQLDYIDEKTVTSGDTDRSRKLINNLHYNRYLNDDVELSLHYGIKLQQNPSNISDWGITDTLQAAMRYDMNESWDAGVQAGMLRQNDSDTSSSYAGLSLGFSPAENTRIEVGFNFEGFDDDDFVSSHYTRQGPYISLNYMLDQSLLKKLNKNPQ